MMNCQVLRAFLVLAAQFAWSGCVTAPPPKQPAPPAAAKPKPQTFWRSDGVTGSAKIVVYLKEQRAHFYKGETIVGDSPISSGRKGFETPPGDYRVTQKHKDHVSNLYGDYVDEWGEVVKSNVDVTKDPAPEGTTFRGSPMPYFLRFHSGYGLHAGRLPGHRASHGCIRLPRTMASHFYENSSYGTPVSVRSAMPEEEEPKPKRKGHEITFAQVGKFFRGIGQRLEHPRKSKASGSRSRLRSG